MILAIVIPAMALVIPDNAIFEGTITANQADFDNVRIVTNTISTTDTNGDLTLSPDGTGNLILPNLTLTTVPIIDASNQLVSSAVTPTELNALIGVSGALVSEAAIQTLTNKTMDGATNTFTDLISANIINVPAGNLAATDNQSAVNELQTDIDTRALDSDLTTHMSDTTTHGTTGNIVGTTDTQTLSAKTLTDPILDASLVLTEITTPSTPAAGLKKFYANTDGKLYTVDDGGVETEVGAGSGGSGGGSGINHISGDDSNAEATVGSWIAYDDGAVAAPVDGTGGSPTVISIARTTTASEILRGAGSFEMAKTAADGQGEGVSLDFTIDEIDQGKEIFVSLDHKNTALYASDDLQIYIYDVTNTNLIGSIINDNDGGIFSTTTDGVATLGSFFAASDSTSYRLILHQTTTNAGLVDFHFDNVSAGPDTPQPSAIITAWKSFTPTGTWVSGNETYTGQWRRVGDSIEVEIKIELTGAPTAASLNLTLPNGLVADTTKMSTKLNSGFIAGSKMNVLDNGGSVYSGGVILVNTTTVGARYFVTNGTRVNNWGTVNATNPITHGTSDAITMAYTVPIVGWSSGNLISTAEALFRNAKTHTTGVTPTGTLTSSLSTTTFGTIDKDGFGLYNTSTGVWTAPKDGVVDVNAYTPMVYTSEAGITARVQVINTTTGKLILGQRFLPGAATGIFPRATGSLIVTKNDILEIQSSVNAAAGRGYSADSSFSITYSKDDSSFGVYGESEIVSAVSSTKTPSGSSQYQQHTGNSLTLQPGSWELKPSAAFFGNNASSPAYSFVFVTWGGANGDDTGTTPTALSAVAGLSIINHSPQDSGMSLSHGPADGIEIVTATSSVFIILTQEATIYLNTLINATTPANARITVYPTAERIK